MGTLFPCPDPLLRSTKQQEGKGLCWSWLRCSCCSSSGVVGLSVEEAQGNGQLLGEAEGCWGGLCPHSFHGPVFCCCRCSYCLGAVLR